MSGLDEVKTCILCKRDDENIKLFFDNERERSLLVRCPYCGMYILPENWRGYNYIHDLEPKIKNKLKYCLSKKELEYAKSITEEKFKNKILETDMLIQKMPKKFSQDLLRFFDYQPPQFSNKKDILDYINKRKDYPESLNEKLNNILTYFYENDGIGENFISIPEEDYSLICVDTSSSLHIFAVSLKEKGLLDVILIENGIDDARLSIDGQLYVEKLLSKKSLNAKTIFSKNSEFNKELINETRTLLHKYPNAEKVFVSAFDKYSKGVYDRNLLDDMRLSLELLLKDVLNNNKSLENQKNEIGKYQKTKGASPELTNMFVKLLDYYAKYQNSNIKHNDNVKQNEIGLIINLTSSFIMFLINL